MPQKNFINHLVCKEIAMQAPLISTKKRINPTSRPIRKSGFVQSVSCHIWNDHFWGKTVFFCWNDHERGSNYQKNNKIKIKNIFCHKFFLKPLILLSFLQKKPFFALHFVFTPRPALSENRNNCISFLTISEMPLC